MRFLLCFSIVKNTRSILSTHVPKGAIECINGIRVISMWWVILGHFLLFVLGDLGENSIDCCSVDCRRLFGDLLSFSHIYIFFNDMTKV